MRKISRKSAIKWGVITLIIVALGALAYTFLKPEETAPNYLTATVEVGDIENNQYTLHSHNHFYKQYHSFYCQLQE